MNCWVYGEQVEVTHRSHLDHVRRRLAPDLMGSQPTPGAVAD